MVKQVSGRVEARKMKEFTNIGMNKCRTREIEIEVRGGGKRAESCSWGAMEVDMECVV